MSLCVFSPHTDPFRERLPKFVLLEERPGQVRVLNQPLLVLARSDLLSRAASSSALASPSIVTTSISRQLSQLQPLYSLVKTCLTLEIKAVTRNIESVFPNCFGCKIWRRDWFRYGHAKEVAEDRR